MEYWAANRHVSRRKFLKIVAVGAGLAGCAGVGATCGLPSSLELSVKPRRLRADEPFVVLIEGLDPGERAVLSANFVDEFLQEWSSTAVFEADEGGMVDTSKHAPVEGSYRVTDPMGSIWSALGANFYGLPTGTSSVTLTARAGDRKAGAEVERYAAADGVDVSDVRQAGLFGRLFLPAGSAARPVPGVLVLGGSEGGLGIYAAYEAALLASHGFAALALAYFRGDDTGEVPPDALPENLVRIPLEYFAGAIEWLGGREGVDPDRLGVVGHSRGGELALLLGATYPELKAVVSYVGSGVVNSSPEGDEPAWTLRGNPVPYLRPSSGTPGPDAEQVREAEIPVERTNGPVFLIAGGDDALWPSERLSRVAHDRLQRHDRPYNDEIAIYPDAGHLIGAPYAPTTPSRRLGGEARANAEACEDSWRKALSLLETSLKR